MRDYLLKRIAVSLLILWVVATLNFVIFQVVSPIDPVGVILDPRMPTDVRDRMRSLFGLDLPLHERYFVYVRNMFTWSFGVSFRTLQPVVEELSIRLPPTVLLLGSAMVATISVGIPVGVLAASRRGSKLDVVAIGSGLFTWGVPVFFLQLLFMLVFAYYFKTAFGFQLVPTRGIVSVPPPENPFIYIADVAWHLALPIFTLVIGSFGFWALYTRNVLLDALTQDYVITARAKGLSERTVLYRHAFRSTLPPIVTMITLAIPGIVTGAMITEWIFTIPGVGRWYLNSLMASDYPVVQSVLFIYAILVIFCNLVADLLYGFLDPRIRVGVRR